MSANNFASFFLAGSVNILHNSSLVTQISHQNFPFANSNSLFCI